MAARLSKRLDERFPVALLYALVLVAGLALYWITAQPGCAWQDSGFHQWRILNRQLVNPLGLALSHPLLIVMGQVFVGLGQDAPTWLNRLSGIGMAVALANVSLLCYWLTARKGVAIVATAMLAVAHTVWWLSTVTETYTWLAAFFTTELVVLVWLLGDPRWWKLTLLAFVNGLALSMHDLALLPLPVYVVVGVVLTLRRRIRWWAIPSAIPAWLAGAALFLGLILQQGLSSGQWGAAFRSALFGSSWQGDVLATRWHAVEQAVLYIALNWPFFSIVPVLVGWWVMPKRLGRLGGAAFGAIAAIELVFAMRYSVPDQFMFFLPTYVMFALGAAVGIDRISMLPRARRRILLSLIGVSLALTPVLYAAMPAVLQHAGRSIRPGARVLHFRDETRYWIVPWKMHEDSAQRFAVAALREVPPDAVILADITSIYPLLITQKVYALGPEVRMIGYLDSQWDKPAELIHEIRPRPTYAVTPKPPYIPAFLLEVGAFEPAGVLWRLHYDIPATEPADLSSDRGAGQN